MPITPDSDLTLTLSAAGGAFTAVFYGAWKIANAVRDLVDEIKGLRVDVRAAWTRQEHERWAFALERDNAHVPLTVPRVPAHQNHESAD